MNLLKQTAARLGIFILGIILIAFGVALTAKASLGNSPISAIPYSLSLCLPEITFGIWVILFNLLMVAIECILLFRKISLINIIIQIALTFTFGGVIDISMYILQFFTPVSYSMKIFAVLIGCIIIVAGALCELYSNISVLPGDGFIMAISIVTGYDFGRIRVLSDIIMSAIALVICLCTLGNPAGVREGTLISAILIGSLVRFFITRYPALRN